MRLATLAEGVGKGIVAGAVGTAAMTASSTIEARLRRRPFSTAPAKAATRALGIETFDDGAAYSRFSNLVHWSYGTGWGIARGVMRALGISPRLATPVHFAALWGSALYTLPKYEVAPPVTEWAAEDVAIDVSHHLVYVAATGAAFELLDRS
jgi:lipoprotein signal peptidase